MAGVQPSFPVTLQENKEFLAGKVPIDLSVTGDGVLIGDLIANTAIPAQDAQIASLSVRASVPELPAIKFGDGIGTVSFSGKAGVFGNIGFFHTAAAAVNAFQFVGDDPAEKESLT